MTHWTWDQSQGALLDPNGILVSRGYSGRGRGKNNPTLQHLRGIGPVPRGMWRIHPPRTSQRTGPYVLDLTPEPGTVTHGRSAFQIHGDSIRAPGTASSGCIILPRVWRERIWKSGVRLIEVVE